MDAGDDLHTTTNLTANKIFHGRAIRMPYLKQPEHFFVRAKLKRKAQKGRNMGNIKKYLDETVEIGDAKKRTRKKPTVTYTVIFSDGKNFVIKKHTKNGRIMAILPEKNQFYLKDTGKDPEPLTEGSMQGFFSGLKVDETLSIPFCTWVDSLSKKIDFVRAFLKALTFHSVLTLIMHGCFRFYPDIFNKNTWFFEKASGMQLSFLEYMPRYVSDIRGISLKDACDCMYQGLTYSPGWDNKYPSLQNADTCAIFLSLVSDWAGPEAARKLFRNCVALDICVSTKAGGKYFWENVKSLKPLCLNNPEKFIETCTFGRVSQGNGLYTDFISLWAGYIEDQMQTFGEIIDPYPETLKSSKYRLAEVRDATTRLNAANNKPVKDICSALSIYSWSNDNFSVVPPRNAAEILLEGKTLSNFAIKQETARDVLYGKKAVLFLRKTSDISKPFATILVENREVKTVLGRFNQSVGKDVLDAVKEWAECLGLSIPDKFYTLEELFPFSYTKN